MAGVLKPNLTEAATPPVLAEGIAVSRRVFLRRSAFAAAVVTACGCMAQLDPNNAQKPLEEKLAREHGGAVPFDAPETLDAINLWATDVPVDLGNARFRVVPSGADRVLQVNDRTFTVLSARGGGHSRSSPARCVNRVCRTSAGVRIEVSAGILSKTVHVTEEEFRALFGRLAAQEAEESEETLTVTDADGDTHTVTLRLRQAPPPLAH